LANYAAIGIDAGRTVTLNGQGLENQGSLVVNGTLIGGGPLLNDTTGFLSGAGTLQGAFTNRGTVKPGNSVGTLDVVGSYTQTASGILQVNSPRPRATTNSGHRRSGTARAGPEPEALKRLPPHGRIFEGVVSATGYLRRF
jgi:hypothetical protein